MIVLALAAPLMQSNRVTLQRKSPLRFSGVPRSRIFQYVACHLARPGTLLALHVQPTRLAVGKKLRLHACRLLVSVVDTEK